MIDDDTFFQLVLARIVEPSSITDTARVIGDLGISLPPPRAPQHLCDDVKALQCSRLP